MLRQAGVAFAAGNARNVLAGPRSAADRLAPLRVEDLPNGTAYELNGCGVTAWAVVDADNAWTLLKGSEVRPRVMPVACWSAMRSSRFSGTHARVAATADTTAPEPEAH